MRKLLLSLVALLCATVSFGQTPKVVLDFTNPAEDWKLPAKDQAIKEATEVTNGVYTVTLSASSGAYAGSYNGVNYLMLGKANSYISLPAFDFATSVIEVVGNANASASTVMNVYVGDKAVSKETTGSQGTNVYAIAADAQAAGNVYSIKVTSSHNAQITKINIYSVDDAPEVDPGEEPEAYEPVGAGTFENPYTVDDVLGIYKAKQQTAEPVWVTGTILGNVDTGKGTTVIPASAEDAVATNLSLGYDNVNISVQLPSGEARAALNLKDNFSNLGKTIAVLGTIELYCGVAGVKNVTDYAIEAEEDDYTVIDATSLSGKYTATTLLCVDDFGTIGDMKNVTATIVGDKDGNVTITGMTEDPLKGLYVTDTDEGETYYAILFSNAQMLTADEETGMPVEIPAFCEVMDNMLLFDYQMVTENERVAAAFVIREGESVEGADAYTASVVLANAQTGEDMAPMNTTAYVMELEDEDGKYLVLFNICGLPAVIGEYAENGDILIYPSMQWPVILDMANEEDMMCIRLTATDNGYTYTVAVPGYAMFASAYVMTINLTKVGGADAIKNVGEVQNDVIYNLQGQRVNKVQKGIVIKNGKKVLVK